MQQGKDGKPAVATIPTRTTVNGATREGFAEVEVSPEVAAVLREREPALKEKLCADVGSWHSELSSLDLDHLAEGEGKVRQNQRPMPAGNPREGKRLHFTIFLGSTLPCWGPDLRDEQGRCKVCHDAELGQGVYCLGCQRCGQEQEVEPVPKSVLATMSNATFDGDKLLGGIGMKKGKSKRAKKAAKKAARAKDRRGR